MYIPKDNMLAIKLDRDNPMVNKPILMALRSGRAKYVVPYGAQIDGRSILLIAYDNPLDKKRDLPDLLEVMQDEELTEISKERYENFKLLPWTKLEI